MIFDLITVVKKKNFDVIFSAGDHLNIMVLLSAILTKSNIKISCSSHVTPFDVYSNFLFSKSWILKKIMKIVMFRANVLTCVSKDMVDQYKKVFKFTKHICIYNVVKDKHSILKIYEDIDEEWLINKVDPVIIAAGMLEPWKGYDVLIIAFKKLLTFKKVRLIILGEGSMRKNLEQLITKLGLNNYVKLKGNVQNPLKYFSRADVFALSSHVEGMPNVLIEAMMSGCTPVSTNCDTGPREVLNNGKYGYLVPVKDPDALCLGLLKGLNNPINKKLLKEAVEPFDESKIIKKHFKYLNI
jgi:glycosyltransferase involved in cell wall biosynthesis